MAQSIPTESTLTSAIKSPLVIGTFILGLLTVLLTLTPLGEWGMTLIAPYGEQASWYLIRASGIVAYVLFGVSTISGLLMSSKLVKKVIPTPLLYQTHQTSSWIGLGLAGLHAILLLFDKFFTFTIANILVPFTGPYEPIWVGFGIIAWYLMALVFGSFYARKQIGQKNWRRLHYTTFIAFILMTLHGMVAGSDSTSPVMMLLYAGFGGGVLFLTLFRVLSATDKPQPLPNK